MFCRENGRRKLRSSRGNVKKGNRRTKTKRGAGVDRYAIASHTGDTWLDASRGCGRQQMRPGLGEHFILSPCRVKEIQHRLSKRRVHQPRQCGLAVARYGIYQTTKGLLIARRPLRAARHQRRRQGLSHQPMHPCILRIPYRTDPVLDRPDPISFAQKR